MVLLMPIQNKLAVYKLTSHHWVLSNGEVWYYLTSTNTFVKRKQNLFGLSSEEWLNKANSGKLNCDLLFDDVFRKLFAAISSPICSQIAPFFPKPDVLLQLNQIKMSLGIFLRRKLTFWNPRGAQEEVNQFSRRSRWSIHIKTLQLARIPQNCKPIPANVRINTDTIRGRL